MAITRYTQLVIVVYIAQYFLSYITAIYWISCCIWICSLTMSECVSACILGGNHVCRHIKSGKEASVGTYKSGSHNNPLSRKCGSSMHEYIWANNSKINYITDQTRIYISFKPKSQPATQYFKDTDVVEDILTIWSNPIQMSC